MRLLNDFRSLSNFIFKFSLVFYPRETAAIPIIYWRQLIALVLGEFPPGQLPPDNCPRANCPLDNCHLGQLPPPPGLFPPTKIAPWVIPPDNLHLELFYCPQASTPGQLLPRAMTITNYNFFMAIFCFFSMA